MSTQDIAIVIAFVLLVFLAASIGYFAHRYDKLDERISNIEAAR